MIDLKKRIMKFGNLSLLDFVEIRKNRYFYNFKCDCGNIIVKELSEVKRHSKRHMSKTI